MIKKIDPEISRIHEVKDVCVDTAIFYGNFELAEMLMNTYKFELDTKDILLVCCFTILHRRNSGKILKFILDKAPQWKIDIKRQDRYGETIWHYACKLGCFETVKVLLTHKNMKIFPLA